MNKGLLALAFGTLGLGITEFVMMGILTDVATNFNIDINTAGNLISAYALGVCFGAPILILARKKPLKHILLALVSIMVVGKYSSYFRTQLRNVINCPFFLWLASWSLFWSRIYCGL